MFPKLIERSFIKLKPDMNLLSFYLNNERGTVEINESAKNILTLCDGTNNIEMIVDALKYTYQDKREDITDFVNEFLKPLINAKIVVDQKSEKLDNIIRGSSGFFLPDSIAWEITDYCPLKCRHCYLDSKNNNIITREDIDYILNIIDSSGVGVVQLTGGEALTHPNIDYIIDKLINKGLTINISTSGVVYSSEILESLKKINLVKGAVRVSVDGNKETHNYIRRNDLAFKKSMSFIKKMIDEGIACQVATSVLNQSKEELEELTSNLKNMGVSVHALGLVSIQGNAKENRLQPKYDKKELNKFLEYLNNKYSSDNFKIQMPQETKLQNCGGGYNLIRIRPNLDVTPCPMSELNFGNLKDKPIDQIMDKRGRAFHDMCIPGGDHCKGCKLEFICGKCIASAFIGKDLVNKCGWYEDQFELINALFVC